MSDPWAFGWTQLLTIVGFVITIIIAIGGFRTFGRWKRERLEEKKIEIALEALSIAYECKFIFETIRNPGSYEYEWDEMPRREGESEDSRRHRGSFYAILKRMQDNRAYFAKVVQLQPRLMAIFGPETEVVFRHLFEARAHVMVSAQMLMRDRGRDERSDVTQGLYLQGEADIWEGLGDMAPHGDRVSAKLAAFRDGLVGLCRPVVDREYRDVKEASARSSPA